MCNQEQDVSISEFLEVGTQLYVSGHYTEMIGFCREFLKISNDERIHSMLALAQSAINDTENVNTTSGHNDIISFALSHDITIFGYKTDFIMKSVLHNKAFYEEDMLKKWFHYGAFKVVLDIGANIGNHTLFFASNSPDAEVYSFEPMPVNYKLLAANVSNNQLSSRVHLYNKAVGDIKCCARMKLISANNNGTARITEDDDQDSETVEVVVIDDLNLPDPDFIKIDTEGHEVQVLRGMKKTLNRSNAFVWLEIDAENALEVYQIMDSLGYEVVDYSLLWVNNVLFGKATQKLYPTGHAFASLLKWSTEINERLLQLLSSKSGAP